MLPEARLNWRIERCWSSSASLRHSRTLSTSMGSGFGAIALAYPAHLTLMRPPGKVHRLMDRDDLAFAGLARHADLIAAGELSSRELVELFLGRIARLDPLLNAFRVVLGEQALAQADQADGRRRAGDTRPLLGVPIAIKDDIHVAGEVTAYGCDSDPPRPAGRLRGRAPAARRGRRDHRQDQRARADGDARSRSRRRSASPATRGTSHRTSGGSSGGSATAVAAGLVIGRDRHRRRRLDPHPRRLLRALRPQAAARPDLDRARRRPAPRHDRLRPAHAHGRRRRALHRRRHGRRARRSPRPPRRRPGGCGSRSRSGSRRSASARTRSN